MASPTSENRIGLNLGCAVSAHRRILRALVSAACLVTLGCSAFRSGEADDDAAVDGDRDAHGSGGTVAGSGGRAAGSGGQGSGGLPAGSGGAGTSSFGSGGGPDASTDGSSTLGTGGSGGTGGASTQGTGGTTSTGGIGSGGRAPGTGGAATGGTATGGTGSGGTGSGGTVSSGTGGAAMCSGQTHMCSGSCVSNAAVANCGTSCSPCQVPTGATATCDGTKCDFTCGNMKKCGAKCVPSDGCCADGDCPAQNGTARQCDTASNTCKASGCASGFKPCNNMCIASSTCCSTNDCTGTCQTCSGPGGSCTAVKNADDTDSCAGTCDGSGACKAKRGQTCNTVSAAAGCIAGSPCSPDGYCCDTACTGSCQACDIKGKEGTCTLVASGAPHGNRTACASDGSTCGGQCAGKADGTCNYPTGNCGSPPSCTGPAPTNMSIAQSTCSAGTCQKPVAKTCEGSLICSGTTCKTSCSQDSDCVGGLVCNSGKCGMKPKMSATKTIDCDAALSGRVQSDGVTDARVAVGDFADNVASCGFLSFPLSSAAIPSGAVVKSASLEIYQQSITGTPYPDLGPSLLVDDTSYPSLSLSLYKAAFASPMSISTVSGAGGRNLIVTALVAKDLSSGAANSQFRICFQVTTDSGEDQDFVLIPTGSTNKPTLTINYEY